MIINTGTESQFEETVIDRLKAGGYLYQYPELPIDHSRQVVLTDVLRDYLVRRYRHLPPAVINSAIKQISSPAGLTIERRNMAFQAFCLRRQALVFS